MSIKHRWARVMLCVALGIASLAGVPMRPEEIEQLLHGMNQPKMAQTNPDDSDKGDDPIEKLRRRGLRID